VIKTNFIVPIAGRRNSMLKIIESTQLILKLRGLKI
jgi:hypothetical protein